MLYFCSPCVGIHLRQLRDLIGMTVTDIKSSFILFIGNNVLQTAFETGEAVEWILNNSTL